MILIIVGIGGIRATGQRLLGDAPGVVPLPGDGAARATWGEEAACRICEQAREHLFDMAFIIEHFLVTTLFGSDYFSNDSSIRRIDGYPAASSSHSRILFILYI